MRACLRAIARVTGVTWCLIGVVGRRRGLAPAPPGGGHYADCMECACYHRIYFARVLCVALDPYVAWKRVSFASSSSVHVQLTLTMVARSSVRSSRVAHSIKLTFDIR